MTPNKTCFQCKHSIGVSWHRTDLYCTLHKARCQQTCEDFEREAGTEEPEENQVAH